MTEPIHANVSLSDQVAGKIAAKIEGHHASGDRLPTESDFLAEYQVSRSALREGIRKLDAVGLLRVHHGQGMFVGDCVTLTDSIDSVSRSITVSPSDLHQISSFRSLLECCIASQAAVLATATDMTELETLSKKLATPGLSHATAIRLDFQFHRKLSEVAGNAMIHNIATVLRQFMLASMLQKGRSARDRDISHQQHLAILNAIQASDSEAARSAMNRHMQHTQRRLEAA